MTTPPTSVAVIGGSGLYSLFDPGASETSTIATPYGAVEVTTGTLGTRPAIFLPRHGTGHSVAPHRIPYRANIWALASLGTRAIISTAAVGAVDPQYPVGTLALPDQYLDRTRGRDDTFFDDDDVQHLPSADPFCPELRDIAKPTADKHEATVAVIPGPRFSTRAESVALRQAGAHLVNMTLYPRGAARGGAEHRHRHPRLRHRQRRHPERRARHRRKSVRPTESSPATHHRRHRADRRRHPRRLSGARTHRSRCRRPSARQADAVRLLVTGGAGFIRQAVVADALAAGWQVRVEVLTLQL